MSDEDDDLVERVARAICCPDGCDGDTGSGKPCDIRREDRTAMEQARAAIAVIQAYGEELMDRYCITVGLPGDKKTL